MGIRKERRLIVLSENNIIHLNKIITEDDLDEFLVDHPFPIQNNYLLDSLREDLNGINIWSISHDTPKIVQDWIKNLASFCGVDISIEDHLVKYDSICWEFIEIIDVFDSAEYKINDFITLKFENNETNIYVMKKHFSQCKYLLLNIPESEIEGYNEIDSIDEIAEFYDHSNEGDIISIPPKTEFWGHCSNLQAWVENDYDTRLLHSNLAFPLLQRLVKVGDKKAKKAYKDEIYLRITSGYEHVSLFLISGGYLDELTDEELRLICKKVKKDFSRIAEILNQLIKSRIEIQKYKDKMQHINVENYFNQIKASTGLTHREIFDLVIEKQNASKGLVNEKDALFVIARELGINIKLLENI